MERDFLGLSDKQYLSNVKREVEDEGGLSKKAAREWGKAKLFATSDFQEARIFPGSYQWGSVSSAANFLRRGQFGGAFQNATPLLLGGSLPLPTHHHLVPRVASSGTSPPLTIFYGGTVSVFHDISPDKAQAIMLCAGNGLKGETVGESSLKKQQPVREAERVFYGNVVAAPAPAPAPAPASSSTATHTDNFPWCRDGSSNAMSNMIKSFNVGPRSLIPSVPQARKASLARFLEKRKERLMSAMPYKKMLLDLSTGESSSTSPT